jgi:hypothetical protein
MTTGMVRSRQAPCEPRANGVGGCGTAGLTREDAADLLTLNASRGKTGTERLAAIEEEEEPTRPQLLAIVRVYRRPLLTFYLAKPPELCRLDGDRAGRSSHP